jgi:phage internal scaffolding protein
MSKTISPPFLRTPYNYDTDAVSLETSLHCSDPSLAQQNSKDECDINVIMERFGRGMALPENFRPPQYGDFEGIADYQGAMNAVVQARESFDQMPAQLRARFHNDPTELIDFLADGENRPEAVKLGLVPPPPQDIVPTPPAPVPDPAPKA